MVRLVVLALLAAMTAGWVTASGADEWFAGSEAASLAMATLRAVEPHNQCQETGTPIPCDECPDTFKTIPCDQWAIWVHVTLADIGVQMMWEKIEVEIIGSTSPQVLRETPRRGQWASTFYIGPHPIPTDPPPEGQQLHRVSVRISAPGYASFTYLNIPLAPGVAHGLTPILSLVEQVNDISVRKPERLPGGGLPGTGTGRGGRSGAFVIVGMLAGAGAFLCAGAALRRKKRERSPLTG